MAAPSAPSGFVWLDDTNELQLAEASYYQVDVGFVDDEGQLVMLVNDSTNDRGVYYSDDDGATWNTGAAINHANLDNGTWRTWWCREEQILFATQAGGSNAGNMVAFEWNSTTHAFTALDSHDWDSGGGAAMDYCYAVIGGFDSASGDIYLCAASRDAGSTDDLDVWSAHFDVQSQSFTSPGPAAANLNLDIEGETFDGIFVAPNDGLAGSLQNEVDDILNTSFWFWGDRGYSYQIDWSAANGKFEETGSAVARASMANQTYHRLGFYDSDEGYWYAVDSQDPGNVLVWRSPGTNPHVTGWAKVFDLEADTPRVAIANAKASATYSITEGKIYIFCYETDGTDEAYLEEYDYVNDTDSETDLNLSTIWYGAAREEFCSVKVQDSNGGEFQGIFAEVETDLLVTYVAYYHIGSAGGSPTQDFGWGIIPA